MTQQHEGLRAWRVEDAAKLEQLREALLEAESEHAAAITAAAAATAAHRAARAAFAPITDPPPGFARRRLAHSHGLRLAWLDAEEQEAERRRGTAHATRERLRSEVGELELALAQIDQLLQQPAAEAA